MPLYHCNDCHHEFEAVASDGVKVEEDWSISVDYPKCDWCGGDSYILQKKTPLEETIENSEELLERLCAYEYQKSCNTRKH